MILTQIKQNSFNWKNNKCVIWLIDSIGMEEKELYCNIESRWANIQ